MEGEIELHFSGSTHSIRSGDFYLITPGHLHRFDDYPGNCKYHGFLKPSNSSEFFTEAANNVANFSWLDGNSIIVKQSPSLRGTFREIAYCWTEDALMGRLVSQCLLLYVLAQLERLDPVLIRRDDADSMSIGDHRLFEEAVKTIEANYKDSHLCVHDIARDCSVSRSLLDKIFHRNVGYGPKEFIQRYRIDRAKELILLDEHSITQIAEETGFPDVFSFSRTFKRITKTPPSRY